MTAVDPSPLPAPVGPRPFAIGSVRIDPPVLQAPMAGYTNYCYRQITRQLGGVGLSATEMINARGFLEIDARFHEYPDRLWGVKEEPRPLAVQIWENDPETLARTGQRLAREFGVSVVDINFGCPVKDVTERAKSGSYLLRWPERIGQIVARVVEACRPTPVTAKIRLGCTRDAINARDVAQAVEDAGGAAITVHGRTAQDMFRGSADWNQIAAIKPHLRCIPLVGNGDLNAPETVVEAFRRYPVDGVMIGRGGLNKPWLFRQVHAALRGKTPPPDPSLDEQREMLLRHYQLVLERFGERKGTILMRKFACCYAQGHPGARFFRSHVVHVNTPDDFYDVVERDFPRNEALLQDNNRPAARDG